MRPVTHKAAGLFLPARSIRGMLGSCSGITGADGGTRTLTRSPSQDFKSCVSTGSTTSASTALMPGHRRKRNNGASDRRGRGELRRPWPPRPNNRNDDAQVRPSAAGGAADGAGAMSNTPRAFSINARSSSGLSTSMLWGYCGSDPTSFFETLPSELINSVRGTYDPSSAKAPLSSFSASASTRIITKSREASTMAGILENFAEAFAHRTPRRVKDHDDRPAGLRCLVNARARIAPVDLGAIPEVGVFRCPCSGRERYGKQKTNGADDRANHASGLRVQIRPLSRRFVAKTSRSCRPQGAATVALALSSRRGPALSRFW